MLQVYTCPSGHQWEDTFGGPSLSPGRIVVCPVCGAPLDNAPTEKQVVVPSPAQGLSMASSHVDVEKDAVTLSVVSIAPVSGVNKQFPKVGGYELMGELGRGGMGVVYMARQVKLNRLVALKMVLGGAHAGSEGLARFRIEAESVAHLQHPNIVQIYEVGEHNDLPYFSMEYVDGTSLASKAGDKAQPPRWAAEMIEKLARAMHCAHQLNVIHRDLKPANVLLTKDGSPKITDFGLAKRLDSIGGQTHTGDVMGTPSYMAPEQAEGKTKNVGPGADIYALGAMLYELLTGRPPFEAETPVDTLLQVIYEEPMPPMRLQPKVPRDLDTICLKAIEKEPRKRYATAEAFAADLRRFLDNQPISARPINATERMVKWAKRRPAVAALMLFSGLLILVLLGGSLFFNFQLNSKNQELKVAADSESAAKQKALEAADGERLAAADAKKQRDKAEELKEIAEKRKELAEKNFQKAREAVKEMLTELGQTELASLPFMEPVRRRLLLKALQFNQEFLQTKSQEPGVRQQAGQAYQQVGEIQSRLGQNLEAQQAYRTGVDLFRQLTNDVPDEPAYRHDLAAILFQRGQFFRDTGRFAEAQPDYAEAIQLRQSLVKQHPQTPEFRQELAQSYNGLADLLRKKGESSESRKFYEEALKLQEQLVNDFGNRPDFLKDLAGSHNDLGNLLRSIDRLAEADKAYLKAMQLLEQLVKQYPDKPEHRQFLAATHNNHGLVLFDLGQADKAAEVHRKVLADRRLLASKFPSTLAYRLELADSLYNLAIAYMRMGEDSLSDAEKALQEGMLVRKQLVTELPTVPDYQSKFGAIQDALASLLRRQKKADQALVVLQDSIRAHQLALKQQPENETYRKFFANHHSVAAETFLQQNNHGEAKRSAEEMLKLASPKDPMGYYRTAGFLARCKDKAEKDGALPKEKQKLAADEYAARAVDLLRLAIQNGFQDATRLEKDTAFQSLKNHPVFQQLLAKLKAP